MMLLDAFRGDVDTIRLRILSWLPVYESLSFLMSFSLVFEIQQWLFTEASGGLKIFPMSSIKLPEKWNFLYY